MEKSEYMTELLKKIGAVPIEQAFPHANLNVLPKTSAEPLMPEVKPCNKREDILQLVHCKDCTHRGNYDGLNVCPMCCSRPEYNKSWKVWEEIDTENTDDDNFCKYGDRGNEHD